MSRSLRGWRVALVFLLQAGSGPALQAAAAPPQEVTLEQALDYALQQNRDLELARLSAEGRQVDVSEARAHFTFTVKPTGSLQSSDDSATLAGGLAVSRPTEIGGSVEVKGTASRTDYTGTPAAYRDVLSIEIEQPLLRNVGLLVNREGIMVAESGERAARRALELKKTDLVVRVAETYEDLLRLQRQVIASERNVADLDRLVRLTRMRERQGRATRVDSLRSEQKHGEAWQALLSLREELDGQRSELAELMGFSPEVVFQALPAPMPRIAVSSREAAVCVALSNRLDYAQVLQDLQDARRGVRIAHRNLLPGLSLTTRYERYGEGASSGNASALDQDAWFVGLSADTDMPRRSERYALRRAGIEEEAAQLRIDALQSGVRKQVGLAVLAYDRAGSNVVLAARSHKLAQSRAVLARRLFERGQGDGFTASDAEEERQDAERAWLDAEAAATVAAYRLLRVVGTLIEYPADLRPGGTGS